MTRSTPYDWPTSTRKVVAVGNNAAVDVQGPHGPVVALLTRCATGPTVRNRMNSVVIPVEGGHWIVAEPAPGETVVLADAARTSNSLARRAFDILSAATDLPLTLRDQHSAATVATRP